ncbi:MAG: solute carrier family 26 protein [Rhodothermales bacterium]|nr:solute carrier family 26 protein [Rhodothermales bacterium]
MRLTVPLVDQLSGYGRDAARADIQAGLTVGVMLVPQGMAYALVAGLPPIYGLYAGLIPLVLYALFGTSRHLAVGPVAMISLLVATAVEPLAGGDADRYVALALTLSLVSGAALLAFGLAQAGFLASFLSHPVLTGFTAAAALIIGSSQLKHVLGVPVESGHNFISTITELAGRVPEANLQAVAFGVLGIAILLILRRVNRRWPGALVVVVAATAVSWLLRDSLTGLSIIGEIPAGLPELGAPAFSFADVRLVAPSALVIGLVGYMESIAIAKSMANRHSYKIDPSAELRALGLANIAGFFAQAFPTTGGLSRTAVNEQAGARTNVAGLVAAIVVGLVLLFLTPAFYHLPKAILGAIILVAVSGLVDGAEFRRLWRMSKLEFLLAALTLVLTLFAGVEIGIMVGVVVSLMLVVYRSSRPHTAVLGRLPDTTTYRNIQRNPDALTDPSVLVYRVDASLYFANIEFIVDQVLELIDDARQSGQEESPVRHVVLDFYSVNHVDTTAEHRLMELVRLLEERGISTRFVGVKGPVRDALILGGCLPPEHGPHTFPDVHSAVHPLMEGSGP